MYMMLVCACVCAGARAYAARPPDCGCTFNWYTQSGYYARVRIRQWERMGVVGGLGGRSTDPTPNYARGIQQSVS